MEATNEVSVVDVLKPAEDAFDEKSCNELFALAKRNLLCGEVPNAVNQLQDVCKQLATKFGETAPECADAYFQYGLALLELARMENRVLGNALKGMTESETEEGEDSFAVPTVMTEEEKEQISEQVIDAMLENESDGVPAVPVFQTDSQPTGTESSVVPDLVAGGAVEKSDAEAKDVKPGVSTVESSSELVKELKASEGEGDEQKTGEDNEAEDEEEKEEDEDEGMDQDEAVEEDTQEKEGSQIEDEDVSNLQLSWEMLELAKTIYQKQETKDAKFKTAECFKKLGEVGLESEQYSQSIEDFNTSLELLKSFVDNVTTDRRLAETHYHIGVSCVNAQRYDEAVTHFRDAITILEAKIVALNAILSSAAPATEGQQSTEDPVDDARKELKELEELIPEIKLKIDDAEEEKSSLVELKKETEIMAKGVTTTGFDSESATSSTDSPTVNEVKVVSDVSHLVRKKRKQEDDSVQAEGTKKSKTSEDESEEKINTSVQTNGNDLNGECKENVKPTDQSNCVEVEESGEKGTEVSTTEKTDVKEEDVVAVKSVEQVVEPIAME